MEKDLKVENRYQYDRKKCMADSLFPSELFLKCSKQASHTLHVDSLYDDTEIPTRFLSLNVTAGMMNKPNRLDSYGFAI